MGTCLLFTWYIWYTYFHTRLQKVGETEMNSTYPLETEFYLSSGNRLAVYLLSQNSNQVLYGKSPVKYIYCTATWSG